MDVTGTKPAELPTVGLIAGWGRYPLVLAETLQRRGRRVIGLGIREHADPRLAGLCDDFREVGLGQLGTAIRYLRRRQVTIATMAGKIHKVRLFERFFWWKHFPDWRCFRTFFPHFVTNTRDRQDDTLLRTIVQAFAEDGITLVPATDLIPEVIVKHGILSRRRPTRFETRDIEFGWRVAREIGRWDIGQTVAVMGQTVLAVEAIEGTDQCIRRAGQLCQCGGFTVVKVAKPQQDMRFDVPTVGMGTLRSLVEAGGRVLAVEADKTILIDEDEVLPFADRHGIAVLALDERLACPLAKPA